MYNTHGSCVSKRVTERGAEIVSEREPERGAHDRGGWPSAHVADEEHGRKSFDYTYGATER